MYKLLTLGILSIVAGLCDSPNTNAISSLGFLTPLDTVLSQNCSASSSEANVSCNTFSSPEVLFSRLSDGEMLWGHDGKGVVFTDAENLVDNNPQLQTARPGDRLNYAMQIETEKYYNDNERNQILSYVFQAGFSGGLIPDIASLNIKINGQPVPTDAYETNLEEYDESDSRYGIRKILMMSFDWVAGDYPDKAVVDIEFSATVDQNAKNQVFVRGDYDLSISGYTEGHSMVFDKYQATALLDGNIVIRRVDGAGNPVEGARYSVEGIKAKRDTTTNGAYVYDENGPLSEFETSEKGIISIKDVPFGVYAAKEISSPDGSPLEHTITKNIEVGLSEMESGKDRIIYTMNSVDGRRVLEFDFTNQIVGLDDGAIVMSYDKWFETIYGMNYSTSQMIPYDAEQGFYSDSSGNAHIYKDGDVYRLVSVENDQSIEGTFVYDKSIEKYVMNVKNIDFPVKALKEYGWLEVNDSIAKVSVGGEPVELTYDKAGGKYSYHEGDVTYTIKKNGADYDLTLDISSSSNGGGIKMSFTYNEEAEMYLPKLLDSYQVLEKITPSEIVLGQYLTFIKDEQTGDYYQAFLTGILGSGMKSRPEMIPAVAFLFRGTIANGDSSAPETTPNPQTSDAVIKVLAIFTTALLPAFAIRKHLTRR